MCQHTVYSYTCGPGGAQGNHQHLTVLQCPLYAAQLRVYNTHHSGPAPLCRHVKVSFKARLHMCPVCEEDFLSTEFQQVHIAAATKAARLGHERNAYDSAHGRRWEHGQRLKRSNAVRISAPKEVAPVSDPGSSYMNYLQPGSSTAYWTPEAARAHRGAAWRNHGAANRFPPVSSHARHELETRYEAVVRFERERKGIRNAHDRVEAQKSAFEWDEEEEEGEEGFTEQLRRKAEVVRRNVAKRASGEKKPKKKSVCIVM